MRHTDFVESYKHEDLNSLQRKCCLVRQ